MLAKKPASKREVWQVGLKSNEAESEEKNDQQEEGEEEVDFDPDEPMDEEDQASKAKDRSKNQKFQLLLANRQLPAFILAEWEKTKNMKVGRIDRQRNIINSIFDRTEAGKLMMNLEKPIFKSMQESFSEKTRTKEEKSLPKTLFKGKFGLTEEQFKEGLANEEFHEIINEDGKVAYTWHATSKKTTHGDRKAMGFRATQEGNEDDIQKWEELGKIGNKA